MVPSPKVVGAQAETGAKRVRVGELEFPVLDRGEGPPVLLLHGFPDSRHLWRHQIPALLDAGLRVLAPDLRGFGEAPKPPEVDGYSIPNVVAEVVGLLDALDVERCRVAGHDWGAVVAWALAALRSDRVERVVALSVGCPGTSGMRTIEQVERSWYAMLFRYGEGVEEFVRADDWAFLRHLAAGAGDLERYIEDLSRPGALHAALNWYRANFHLDLTALKHGPQLPRITCPVLGVWSDGDRYLTEEGMIRARENVDGPWRYERIEGASHWMMLDRPQEISHLLVEFLGV